MTIRLYAIGLGGLVLAGCVSAGPSSTASQLASEPAPTPAATTEAQSTLPELVGFWQAERRTRKPVPYQKVLEMLERESAANGGTFTIGPATANRLAGELLDVEIKRTIEGAQLGTHTFSHTITVRPAASSFASQQLEGGSVPPHEVAELADVLLIDADGLLGEDWRREFALDIEEQREKWTEEEQEELSEAMDDFTPAQKRQLGQGNYSGWQEKYKETSGKEDPEEPSDRDRDREVREDGT